MSATPTLSGPISHRGLRLSTGDGELVVSAGGASTGELATGVRLLASGWTSREPPRGRLLQKFTTNEVHGRERVDRHEAEP